MLYHVSTRKIDKFKLKVPLNRLQGEDGKMKRVCFSRSLEGAISAMPYGYQVLLGLMRLKSQKGIPSILYVYMVDELEIDRRYILKSKVLKKKGFVPDAKINSEVWLLTEKFNFKEKVIEVDDFYLSDAKIGDKYVRCVEDVSYNILDLKGDVVKKYNEFWSNIEDDWYRRYKEFKSNNVVNEDAKNVFLSIAKREFMRNYIKM